MKLLDKMKTGHHRKKELKKIEKEITEKLDQMFDLGKPTLSDKVFDAAFRILESSPKKKRYKDIDESGVDPIQSENKQYTKTTLKQEQESRPVQVMTFFPLNDEEKARLLEQHRTGQV